MMQVDCTERRRATIAMTVTMVVLSLLGIMILSEGEKICKILHRTGVTDMRLHLTTAAFLVTMVEYR